MPLELFVESSLFVANDSPRLIVVREPNYGTLIDSDIELAERILMKSSGLDPGVIS